MNIQFMKMFHFVDFKILVFTSDIGGRNGVKVDSIRKFLILCRIQKNQTMSVYQKQGGSVPTL